MAQQTLRDVQEEIISKLRELDAARDKAREREEELIAERKSIDAELKELNDGDEGYAEKIARWGEIQRDELPACRSAKNHLANELQKWLKRLLNPKMEFQNELPFQGGPSLMDPIALGKHVRAQAKRKGDDEDGEEEDDDRPVGTPRPEPDDPDQTTIEDHLPPESAARGGRKPAGDPEWFGTDVREIGLPDAQATALWLADFRTLGDVVREGLKAAQTAGGVTPYAASYLEAVIKDLHAGAPLKEAVQRARTGNIGQAYKPWTPAAAAPEPAAEQPDEAEDSKPKARRGEGKGRGKRKASTDDDGAQ